MHPLSLFDFTALLGLGAALGFFGGLFGIGGGVIAIPLLVLGFGMPQATAQGTALVLMVPNLLIGWRRYSQRHPVPLRSALLIGGLASLTTLLVAQLATRLAPGVLRAVFSVFLLVLVLQMLLRHRAGMPPAAGASRFPARLMPLVGLLGGSCMGLLGIGGGLVATPLFAGPFGQRQSVAQSLSLALVAPSSVIALFTYASAGSVDWVTGLPLALGGLLSVSAGVALAHRLPEARLRGAFAWMLLSTALWLLLGLALRF